jgi:hypothetical protein
LQHGVHAPGEKFHRVRHLRLIALAVTWKIDEDELRLRLKRRDLVAPPINIPRPAVDKDDRLSAVSGSDVMNLVSAKLREVGLAQRRFGCTDGQQTEECCTEGTSDADKCRFINGEVRRNSCHRNKKRNAEFAGFAPLNFEL